MSFSVYKHGIETSNDTLTGDAGIAINANFTVIGNLFDYISNVISGSVTLPSSGLLLSATSAAALYLPLAGGTMTGAIGLNQNSLYLDTAGAAISGDGFGDVNVNGVGMLLSCPLYLQTNNIFMNDGNGTGGALLQLDGGSINMSNGGGVNGGSINMDAGQIVFNNQTAGTEASIYDDGSGNLTIQPYWYSGSLTLSAAGGVIVSNGLYVNNGGANITGNLVMTGNVAMAGNSLQMGAGNIALDTTASINADGSGNITLYGTAIQFSKALLKGIVIDPETSAPSSPAAGQCYFNTTSEIGYQYNGTNWLAITSPVMGTLTVTSNAVTPAFTQDGYRCYAAFTGSSLTVNAITGTALLGQSFTILVKNGYTGTVTPAWNSIYDFGSGSAPAITTGKYAVLTFLYNAGATKWICTYQSNGF